MRRRPGEFEVCALPFSMHTEAYSIDELARGLRFAERSANTACPSSRRCRRMSRARLRRCRRCSRTPASGISRSPTTTQAARCRTCTAASAWSAVLVAGTRRRAVPSGTRTARTASPTWRATWWGWPSRPTSPRNSCPSTSRHLRLAAVPLHARLCLARPPRGDGGRARAVSARPAPPAGAERHRRQRACRGSARRRSRATGTPASPTRGCASRRTASSSSAPRSASATG